MTERFLELERKLATLPEEKREEWISHFLEELDLETAQINGDASDEGEWIGGRKPTQDQVTRALEQLDRFSKGKILGEDVTLKDLINEGRRY